MEDKEIKAYFLNITILFLFRNVYIFINVNLIYTITEKWHKDLFE